jgi:hypothetical protein
VNCKALEIGLTHIQSIKVFHREVNRCETKEMLKKTDLTAHASGKQGYEIKTTPRNKFLELAMHFCEAES